ncbi:dolichyl-phosphate beta-D-mannosyltransferase [Candidatus Woesebacteria bacterium]|nr:dolichyl-phosphate beta-D-mannosyltransferase [Candidatus Woesebacteria bacterium]
MRIIVIIPTYNEVENIGKMLDVLTREEFPKIKDHSMKILVVDDNSPDGTADVVRKEMKINQNVELLLGSKQGLGVAYVRGMKYAMKKMNADAVIELDADFQHDPRDVKRLVAAMDEGYDQVIGSRYIKGGSIPKEWEFYRKFISWGGNLFARVVLLMFTLHDATSGFKLTKVKGFLDHVTLNRLLSKSYAYKIHILYEIVKERSARVKEVPIKFHFRERGSSKIEHEDVFESFKVVILLFFRSRFFKFAIVGLIGFSINAFFLEFFRRFGIFDNLGGSFSYLEGSKLNILSQPSAWSAAAAGEVAIVSNFILNNFWTFASNKFTQPLRILWKFLEFNLTSLGAVFIQFAVIGTAVGMFGDTIIVRQLALVGAVGFLIVPYNYTMYNIFIWKRWKIPGLAWLQR